MYLKKANSSKLNNPKIDITKKFYERLEKNITKVYYKINSSQYRKEIEYFYVDEIFGTGSFSVSEKGEINYYNYDEYSTFPGVRFIQAFILFVIRKENNLNQDELRELYGELYDEEIVKQGMSKEQVKEFNQTKLNFKSLLSSLQNINCDDKDDVEEDKIYFKMFIKTGYIDFDFNIRIYDNNLIDTGTFNSVYDKYILEGKPLEESSKRILMTLSSIALASESYKVRQSYKIILGQVLKDLKDQDTPSSFCPINYDDVDYYLNKDMPYIELSLDENGTIVSSIDNDLKNIQFIDFDVKNQVVAFNKDSHIATIYLTHNEKEKALLIFRQQNNMFNSTYFEKEITKSLVPLIKDSVNIEKNYLSKAMKNVDHIEYYVDSNKVKDDIELLFKTKYFIDGNEVDEGEFSKKHFDIYTNFSYACSGLKLTLDGTIEDMEVIANFVSNPLTNLKKYCQIFVSDEVKKLKKSPLAKINIVVTSEEDWLSLEFQSNDYSKEEIDAILSAYKKKKKYYCLNNKIISLEEGNGQDIINLTKDFDLRKERIPLYQALKLQARQDVSVSNQIKELFENVKNYENQELHLNDSLTNILRPYQITGVKWLTTLKENHLSGILADDMGLGKTLEMIAFLSQYKNTLPNLVVCPKSLTYNWEDEFHKWYPDSKVVVLSASKVDRHEKLMNIKEDDGITYIISYDSLRIDLELFKDKKFEFLILDEGQYISNSFSQKSRAVKNIDAKYKFALTGTPIQNSLMDLWSLFDFLMPGYLKQFHDFKKLYGKFDLDDNDRKHLENIASPFILKRKKDDVLTELPGKIIINQNLNMDDKERKLYEAYLINAKNMLEMKKREGRSAGLEVLSALTRLRQICVDPSSFLEYIDVSTKLDYSLTLIKEALDKGHKILVFSSFTSVLDHLSNLLNDENIIHATISGETSATKRLSLAKDFNTKDDIKVMLISLKAGGTGLNLIGADIVIHLDPWWNIAVEDQASDRAYRIGQNRKVTIYKLVMKSTIEEKVLSLQDKKKKLSNIFDNANSSTGLSDDDIKFLLD